MRMPSASPVRWGFIGAGRHATLRTAPALRAARTGRLFAAAARDRGRAAALAPEIVLASYAEVIEHPDVEAVYISIANDKHAEWAHRALSCGKAVLCEKPLAMNRGEVDRLIEVASRTGLLLAEATWYRWHPRIRAAETLIGRGDLGSVYRVRAEFALASLDLGGYRADPASGGGVLLDLGPYVVSAVLSAFGWADVLDVSATAWRTEAGLDTRVEGALRFAAGTAEFIVDCAPRHESLTIQGEKGRLDVLYPSYAAAADEPTTIAMRWSDGRPDQYCFDAVNAYQLMFEDVSSHLRGANGYVVPVGQSRAVADVLDRIRSVAAGPTEADRFVYEPNTE
jgi:D-xylose 1-dehydrogenase (NADP+, D-xylono-1,5-lactone-forming)